MIDEAPIASLAYTPLQLGTYTRLRVELRQTRLINRPMPGSDSGQFCVAADEDDVRLLVLSDAPYSTDVCQQDCALQSVLTGCACLLPIDRCTWPAALPHRRRSATPARRASA